MIKAMAVRFDRDFARVWSDEATPYIFTSLLRIPERAEVADLATMQLELVHDFNRTFREAYSIIDIHLCPSIPEHFLPDYLHQGVLRQFKAGLKHKAFIAQEKNATDTLTVAISAMEKFPISVHNSFENALKEVNTLRIQSRPLNLRSVFDFLNNL
jgi:hypothetical protein